MTALKVGGDFFSGKEDGYDMTLHTKNDKAGCISFRFINFYSQGGGRDFFL